MTHFGGFSINGIPEGGYYWEVDQYWIIRPRSEWVIHEYGGWLEIGGPGCDGVSWALRKDEAGVFAHYPIENRFEWKAKDVESLIAGWIDGRITV